MNDELNKWILENIFNYKWYRVSDEVVKGSPHLANTKYLCGDNEASKYLAHNYYVPSNGSEILDGTVLIHDFCGNIKDAFRLVEKMQKLWRERKNNDEGIYWQFIDCEEYGWRVEISWAHHDGDISLASAAEKTLPLAICVALKEFLTEATIATYFASL